ncbi:hypothetical protein BDR06DRAFT_1003838 [Suillus hirtellus]|nr:hypothetical protein BDR06DRAFT_1003838 [Suillus hirtellus]
MSTPVDNLAAELFAITLTDNEVNSDSHHKLWVSHLEVQRDKGKSYLDAELTGNDIHITHALQAAEVQHQSRAEVTLSMMESRMERVCIKLSRATSRDALQSIHDELATIIKILMKVKHKVSSVISHRTRLEVLCDEIQKLLFNKEDGLPVLSEPVEFDSSHHYDLPIDYSDKIA